MVLTQISIDITNRFFKALDILKLNKKIRGLGTFARAHDINRWNLTTVKNTPGNSYLKTEWIYYLSKDYNVSLDWIFFGEGPFYNSHE